MPKKSFFRLPDERQMEIYNASIHLFMDNNYEEINMKKVLQYLSMNPGTFYRYFEDKDDLYCYLIRVIVHKRVEFFNQNNEDFLYNLFISGLFGDIDGAGAEPLDEIEIEFLETFSKIPESLLLKVYTNVLKGESIPFIKDALRQMRLNGDLRPNIDDDMVSFMFESMQFNIIMFLREYKITDSKMQQKIYQYFVDFMGHGLLEDKKYSELLNN
ncbi:MAG: TetR/AcrR family transcriptional regulator [Lachnospiraceae bacterium]|nr:TetR/AcrR family transcriptional regulator [Lachnospiraceae bacterium]